MKKVTPKQATIIVKSGISNLFRELGDKKIADKANTVKNDVEYIKRVTNLYAYKVDFAKDADDKIIKLSNSIAKGASVDDVAKAAKADWPDLAKKILG